MNRTFQTNPSKAVAWSRLLILLAGETALFGLFLALGSNPARRVDFAHFTSWLDATAPMDVVVAIAFTVGIIGSFWLFASTLLYMGAVLTRLTRVENGLRVFTLPVVRRVVDGALAVSIAGTSLFGAGRMAFAAPVARDAVVSVQASKATSVVHQSVRPQIVVRAAEPADEDVPTPAGNGTDTAAPETPAADQSNAPAQTGGGDAVVRPPGPVGPSAGSEQSDPGATVDEGSGEAPTPAGPGTTDTTEAPAPDPGPAPAGPSDDRGRPDSGGSAVVRPGAPTAGAADDTTGEAPDPSGAGVDNGTASGDGTNGAATPDAPQVAGESAAVGTYTVQAGDNFWTIAANHLQAKLGRTPSNEEVRQYWVVLIEANQANISSGNPSLIYPGETFVLPPL